METWDDHAMAIGMEFPHPNQGLKFLALDAKMDAMEVMFMMCGCPFLNSYCPIERKPSQLKTIN